MLLIFTKRMFSTPGSYGPPVISVGNITSGGTGKTPLVMEVVRTLQAAGKKVAVASSGFRDETLMMGGNFPGLTFVRKNRRELENLGEFAGTVVLDDGFHCRWIRKNLNILLVDASNPFDNNLMIPSGLLREPRRFMREADVFVVTKTHMVSGKRSRELYKYLERFRKAVFVMDYEIERLQGKTRIVSSDVIPGSNVVAFTGIGSPMNFFSLLATLNPAKINGVIYPDHFYYREKDVDELCRLCLQERTDCIITTQKDFVKLKNKWPQELPLFYLAIKPVLKDIYGRQKDFDMLLQAMLK